MTHQHPKERLLKQALTELAEAGVPAGTDLWPRIQPRLKPKPEGRRVRRPRWGWALAGIGALMVLATAAYAAGPLADAVLRLAPGWAQAGQAGLFRHYGLSQSQNGWTVRLELAYADPNQVLVVLWVEGPTGPGALGVRGELSTADGRPLRPEMAGGVAGRSDLLGLELKPGESGHVLAFDGWGLGDTAGDVALTLAVTLSRLEPAGPSAGGSPILMRERQVAGPFRFEFKVPVVPARAEVRGREAVAGGLRARLERLVLAPTGLKVRACFEGPAGGSGIPRLVLEPGPGLAPMLVSAEGTGCYRWVIAGGLSELSGRRTLKLFSPDGQREPWTFELDLP